MGKEFSYEDLLKIPPKKKPCFLKGTLVLTQTGLKPMENINLGELVLSYNQKKGINEYKPVSYIHNNNTLMYLNIFTENGNLIQATGTHLFFIPDLKKWLPANKLKLGMSFINNDSKLIKIEKLDVIEEKVETFNLEVKNNNNYYVSEDKILTHNGMSKSIFNSLETVEVIFYTLDGAKINRIAPELYVGKTIQKLGVRFDQHKKDFKTKGKKKWMTKVKGIAEIQINGIDGPFRMTPYETAVTELYELNVRGGKKTVKNPRKDLPPLENRQNPIGKKKFEYFKKNYPEFNPCKFYA